MKLTAILLLAACLQISAKGVSQNVTLSLKNVSVEKAFQEIKKQTGYNFIYYKDLLAGTKNINLSVRGQDLETVLKMILKDQPLTYTISGKYIVIKKKEKTGIPVVIDELFPPIDVRGRIVNEKGEPVEGASVQVKSDATKGTSTNADGYFTLTGVDENATLVISGVNVEAREVKLSGKGELGSLVMKMKVGMGEEVIVNTGYQSIPKERATGSFSSVNNTLFNRSVSTDVLSRLENVTSGLLFDRRSTGRPALSIRGRSTILSDANPLIVVDNFPYEGDINNLNPNDIESVTILKDAAAASIWGTRAGNGVIVITTKKGKHGQPLRINLNTNFTIGEKPDLFYGQSFLNSKDFIEVEQELFSRGYYKGQEGQKGRTLSPVVNLLIAERDGKISSQEAQNQLNELKTVDVRDQFSKYFYQKSLNQQHSLSLAGSSPQMRYYLSGGFDRNIANLVRNDLTRITVHSSATYLPIKALEIRTGIGYMTNTQNQNNGGYKEVHTGGGKLLYPYAKIAAQDGTSLPIVRDYNSDYIESTIEKGFLDWQYRPLEDLKNANYVSGTENIRINTAIKYRIAEWVNMEADYQYQQQRMTTNNHMSEKLYYVRDLINQYTFEDDDGLQFPVPRGSILDKYITDLKAHSGRMQLNFHYTRNLRHEFNALIGSEIRMANTMGYNSRLYGYNEDLSIFETVDLSNQYPVNPYGYSNKIPSAASVSELTDRNISHFANAAYTYNQRYIVSASARKDASNLFGVNANQRWVPLWSAGVAWIASAEKSFPFESWLPFLKLRMTWGYSGNVNKSLTAYTTASYSNNLWTGLRQLQILTPPNAELRWEKINMMNIGLDFRTRNNMFSGSLEYYTKKGVDLIGNSPLDPTAGFNVAGKSQFTGNNADLKGHGVDIQLSFQKTFSDVTWFSDVLFSYTTDKVTHYEYQGILSSYLSSYPIPVVGKPRFGVYSFKFAGLDPENGDPLFYIGDEVSKAYSTIYNRATIDDLVYSGPALPTTFGSWRNNFTFRQFNIGFNVSYKFGYYFKRSSINYVGLFDNWSGHIDFEKRWQKPGDELITNIPSMPVKTNSRRETVFNFSSALVERGDHIRFQDINLSYRFERSKNYWLPFNAVSLTGYINNLGILWKANTQNIDPDFVFRPYPLSKTYSFGLNIEF